MAVILVLVGEGLLRIPTLDEYADAANALRIGGGILLVSVAFGLYRRGITKVAGTRSAGDLSPPLSIGQKTSIVVLVLWSVFWAFYPAAATFGADPGISWVLFLGLEGLLLLIGLGGIVGGFRGWRLIAVAAATCIAALSLIDVNLA